MAESPKKKKRYFMLSLFVLQFGKCVESDFSLRRRILFPAPITLTYCKVADDLES
jgi:hypothetical protein